MSYDVNIKDTWLNITYNVSPMFIKAFRNKEGLKSLDGKRCKFVKITVLNAYIDMCTYPTKYKRLNPKNGWGSYEGTKQFLHELLTNIIIYPQSVISIE